MEDFGYLVLVSFSGADLSRALWLGLCGSLFCTSKLPPVKMGFILFAIDRIWPFVAMGFSGYGIPEIAASVAYMLTTIPQDATFLLFRFLGILGLCGGAYHLRVALHRGRQRDGKSTLTVPY